MLTDIVCALITTSVKTTVPSTEVNLHVARFVLLAKDSYILVEWPHSQEYMDKEWFDDEAVLHHQLSSAYFIPLKRYYEN